MKYRLNEPYLKGKEKEYVNDVLDSGWLSINGKHTKIFEQKFAEMIGLKYALAVQSGTAALHAALLSIGIGNGDKVIVPNFTCAACATTILQCGGTPIILDVEDDTFCLDYNLVKRCVKEEKPKAIMLVHIYGFPARDTEKIAKLCKKEKILLIEDCSEAHGAEINGKKVGTFGDIATFSLRSEKMIGVGEGGIILTNNHDFMARATFFCSRAAKYRSESDPYWYTYYYSDCGMNYLMPHLLGAVGRGQIENFKEILRRKRAIAKKYRELLVGIDGIRLQKALKKSKPSYWLNIILLEKKDIDEVHKIGTGFFDKGIEIRPAFWPLSTQEFFKKYSWGPQDVAINIFNKGIILPSSVYLEDNNFEGIEFIVSELKNFIK